MKILLIATDTRGDDAISEVRRVQQWHDVVALYGKVTPEDVYRSVQDKAFDVLHFAAPCGPDGVLLSDGAVLTAEDIAQFVRLRETTGVYFSGRNTGRLASYCVRHGARWAISSEADFSEADAWKLAAAFYAHQRNGHAKDFIGAYRLADSGDGGYALHLDPAWVQDLQRAAAVAAAAMPHAALTLSRSEAMRWAVALTLVNAALSLALRLLGGG